MANNLSIVQPVNLEKGWSNSLEITSETVYSTRPNSGKSLIPINQYKTLLPSVHTQEGQRMLSALSYDFPLYSFEKSPTKFGAILNASKLL